jgi:hypothetical protein
MAEREEPSIWTRPVATLRDGIARKRCVVAVGLWARWVVDGATGICAWDDRDSAATVQTSTSVSQSPLRKRPWRA